VVITSYSHPYNQRGQKRKKEKNKKGKIVKGVKRKEVLVISSKVFQKLYT
jgi:hypothetical protein